ncbi:hypothetical protein IC235_02995 [Hymenobacter sp. BT664]|uniref:Uncharacterized protein n=1 Tax=Hymenobacter montanus TaxID=2771359 RepID=A0A927GHZ4_9BACT|nr:hypothetical protein [Hymenobacter montanus]MBD2766857.1 hypothetical protein [Hymenobacter montanus]
MCWRDSVLNTTPLLYGTIHLEIYEPVGNARLTTQVEAEQYHQALGAAALTLTLEVLVVPEYQLALARATRPPLARPTVRREGFVGTGPSTSCCTPSWSKRPTRRSLHLCGSALTVLLNWLDA